jgi:Cu/Ag efflux protein CusF
MRIGSFLLLAVCLFSACTSPAPLPPADHAYTTRGVVERLPGRNDEHVMILHEAIGDFVGMDGKPASMASMSMPFAVADGVSLAGVDVGTKVEFTFEVRWSGGEPLLVIALSPLPEDTRLELD